MKKHLLRFFVRSMFTTTSRTRALHQAERILAGYKRLARGVTPELGCRSVTVPPMPGVDEEMRGWSFFMILAHNTIVNRSISAMTEQLARGEGVSGAAALDMKKDVLPSPTVGEETLAALQESVQAHLRCVATLGNLRGTRCTRHPIFGNFDAHKWHCMFAFHMRIHYRQAAYVVRALNPPSTD